MFRHSDGVDLQRLRYSSGATPEQALENYSLQCGQAIVRLTKSRDLHKVTVPLLQVDKFIPRTDVDRLMADRLADLNRDVVPARRNPPPATVDQQAPERLPIDDEERAFLECLAKNFERPSTGVYKELGIGESRGHRLKKRLLGRGFISQVTTNLGKGGKRAKFLIPTAMVCEDMGIKLGSGRGGALHRHFQAGLTSLAEQHGYSAVVEESVNGSSVAADVGMERNGERIAVEICVTSKPATESANIEKSLKLGFNRVVLTFVNRQVLEKTREISTSRYAADIMERVSFCLVNQFMSALGE